MDESSKIIWRGMVDTHPEFIDAALKRFHGQLAKVGLETGPFTPHLFRSLAALDHPMVCIDAHRAADAIKSRRIPLMSASVAALLESLASIESQIARLDDELDRLARRNEVAWRLMSVPGVGRVTALAFIAAIENADRFHRTRDIGAYFGLTERHYQSADTDIRMGISKRGDAMARHYLYETANVLLTTVKKSFALRKWGIRLMKKVGPKSARVAVARKLAVLLGRIWKDGSHFEANAMA